MTPSPSLSPTVSPTPRPQKIILVAGGGDFPENNIPDETRGLAQSVYDFAQLRKFKASKIQYLSAFATPAPGSIVDAPATIAELRKAILEWGRDAGRLFIFLIDHGERNRFDQWLFLMNGTLRGKEEYLEAHQLRQMLDEIQINQGAIPEIVLVVECCKSGGFIAECANPLANQNGRRRIIFTSTGDDVNAKIGGKGGLDSFTYLFLSATIRNESLEESFLNSLETAQSRLDAQIPWMDDDGDGMFIPGSDGETADDILFGEGPGDASLPPRLLACAPSEQLVFSKNEELWVDIDGNEGADQAEAFVYYHDKQTSASKDLTQKPILIVPLKYDDAASSPPARLRYRGSLAAADIRRPGDYALTYFAYKQADPARPSTNTLLVSNALVQTITVANGPDQYEEAPYLDSARDTTQNVLALAMPQFHTIHDPVDEDWGTVFAASGPGETYRLEISDYAIPADCILFLDIYNGTKSYIAWVKPSDSEPVSQHWNGEGNWVDFRVRACKVKSPINKCLDAPPINSDFHYKITFKSNAADKQAPARQLDARRFSIPLPVGQIPVDDRPFIKKLNLYRNEFVRGGISQPGEILLGEISPLLFAQSDGACDCPVWSGISSTCMEFIDHLDVNPPAAGLGNPTWFEYRIEQIYTNGGKSILRRWSAGYNVGMTQSESPFCGPIYAPIVEPTQTPAPTASQTNTPIPQPTKSATPVPSSSTAPPDTPTQTRTYTPTPSSTSVLTPSASPTPTLAPLDEAERIARGVVGYPDGVKNDINHDEVVDIQDVLALLAGR